MKTKNVSLPRMVPRFDRFVSIQSSLYSIQARSKSNMQCSADLSGFSPAKKSPRGR